MVPVAEPETGNAADPVLVLGALLSSNPVGRWVTRAQIGVYSLGLTLAWCVPLILILNRTLVGGAVWGVLLGIVGWIWVYGSMGHRLATQFGCVKCFSDHVSWRERGKGPVVHRLDTAGFGHIGLDGRTEIVAAHRDLPGRWLRVRVSRFTCEDDLDALEAHLVGADPDRPLTVGQEGEVRTTCPWTWESVFPGRALLRTGALRRKPQGHLEITVGEEIWTLEPRGGRVRCRGEVVFHLGPRWVHAPSGLVLGTMAVTDLEAGLAVRFENGDLLRIDGDALTLSRPNEPLLHGTCTPAGDHLDCTWATPVHPVVSALTLIARRCRGFGPPPASP